MPPHVVIVGGGFGGLTVARALRRDAVRITLVDRHNYHLFQPLLYQVATAVLSPADIAAPIRLILRHQRNVRVLLAEAHSLDPDRRVLQTDAGDIHYDYLILATGASHDYFGRDEWAQYAPGLKTLRDGLEIRHRVLLAFERAEREPAAAARGPLLTFVVVGAGPTGVELAGALAGMARRELPRDFHAVRPGSARVVLIEAAPEVLPTFSEPLRTAALRSLQKLGVEVRTGTMVTAIEDGAVTAGGDTIHAGTILWAAGVAASELGRCLGVSLDRAGRIPVGPDLRVPEHPEIFVIGDLALTRDSSGKPLPGLAAVAVQQGRHVAANLRRALQGKALLPFRYRDRGVMATIGRGAAVAELGRVRLTGRVAWLAWLGTHLAMLIGFRSRLVVLMQWASAYFTYQRAARLITGDDVLEGELRTERRAQVAGRK